ncbi:VTT domain-containing protein [Roseateles sp. LKC17W]|uniref:VTT domain-containing protein n=1 Tax=Pelomonas margarita TaxID=3299031 RepID=A0ABW7FDX4_9BURK
MDIPLYFIDLLANFDKHLQHWCTAYGIWALAIVALIMFAETGFVFFPFLPGDSMLFVIGIFCGAGVMDFKLVIPVLITAAVAGDAVNFVIGRHCGSMLLRHLPRLEGGHRQAQNYFCKHGVRTIVMARFIPVLRGFAPFAAGFGRMRQSTFTQYNVMGAVLWVVSLIGLGMAFGDLAIIRQNLSKAILGIIVLSLVPLVFERLTRKPASVR